MSTPANVRSIDALERLAVALQVFQQEASAAVDDLTMDMQRAIQWVQYDQKEYWTDQIRRAEAEVTEAKLNLERRKLFRIGDREPTCDEEKKALDAAKRRLGMAREKLEAVRRWSRLLVREAIDCKSGTAPLKRWLETDAPQAVALLKRMTGALESYVDLRRAPETGSDAAVGATVGPQPEQRSDTPSPAVQAPPAPGTDPAGLPPDETAPKESWES